MSGNSRSGVISRLLGGKNDYQYTRLGAQVQNVKKSDVYVFGDGDLVEDETVEFELQTVRSRKGPRQCDVPKECQSFVERRITEDDTLQSLSLQYGCSVSELKRVNNLIKDQDFYGLIKVKIPVKNNSFLIEKINEEETKLATAADSAEKLDGACVQNGATALSEDEVFSHDSDTESTHDLSDPETQRKLIRTISINHAARSQTKEARDFLRNMDKDLSKIRDSTRTDRNSLNEVISVLTNKSVYPLAKKKSNYLNGADCGITWRRIVITVVIIAVLVPMFTFIVYLIYMYKGGR